MTTAECYQILFQFIGTIISFIALIASIIAVVLTYKNLSEMRKQLNEQQKQYFEQIRDILNGKFSGGDTLKVLSAFRVFFCLVFI